MPSCIPLADYVTGREMTATQADSIRNAVASKLNIVISGRTGLGKYEHTAYGMISPQNPAT